MRKEASGTAIRLFKYSITGNYMEPLNTLLSPDGTAVLGDKLWAHTYMDSGTVKRSRLYLWKNSSTEVFRLQLF